MWGCAMRSESSLKTCPDEEGIKTISSAIIESIPSLKTCPDEEGIKTSPAILDRLRVFENLP